MKDEKRILVIVDSKMELIQISDHTMIVDTSFCADIDTNMDTNYKKSGLSLLCLGVLGGRDKSDEITWDKDLFTKIKSSKGNIFWLGKGQHFNLDGGYYSYGNSFAYRIFDNSSVIRYANKKSRNLKSQMISNTISTDIEK